MTWAAINSLWVVPLGEGYVSVWLPCGCEGMYDAELVLIVAMECKHHERG